MVNNTIGAMVAAIRSIKGLSQVQLADVVPPAYLSRFENGKMVLSDKHLTELERKLGVDFTTVRPVFEQFVAAVNADNTNGNQPEAT